MAGDNASERLRQAISLNDLALVRRILRIKPYLIHNPNFSERADTSLHLAASLGHVTIARHLISLGHDNTLYSSDSRGDTKVNHGISVNVDGQTPLHTAAAGLHTSVVEMLCQEFPTTINRKDREGRTPLLLAAGALARSLTSVSRPAVRTTEDTSTITVLLSHGADVMAKDFRGNTCLHNACAFGNLKAIRALMEAGADPMCTNFEGWKPELYSLTVQAEVYYRNLVSDFEKRKAEEQGPFPERKGKGGGTVRLVAQDDEEEEESDSTDSYTGRSRADSGKSQSTFASAMS